MPRFYVVKEVVHRAYVEADNEEEAEAIAADLDTHEWEWDTKAVTVERLIDRCLPGED